MKRAQAVRLTAHAALSFAAVLSISCLAVSQVPQKFSLLITKIERVNNGCVVQAQSSKVLFRVSSDISGPCSMLRVSMVSRPIPEPMTARHPRPLATCRRTL